MLRIDRTQNALKPMENRSLADAGYQERYGLQQLICRNPELFFAELGEDLLLVGQELLPADLVDDRIDVLALDKQGATVVIELKRGSNHFQLLQGISYAAMIADWSGDELLEAFRTCQSVTPEEAQTRVEQFLTVEPSELNSTQRIILVAEDFDLEVLAAAKWLSERTVDIRCYRLVLSADDQSEVLSCTCVFPLAQLEDHARRRSRRTAASTSPADWEAALERIANTAIRQFILAEVAAGRDANVKKRSISFRLGGTRRFHVGARANHAYVWQEGRFGGDLAFWRDRLAPEANVEPINDGDGLRFFLHGDQDCARFKQAVEVELVKAVFVDTALELAELESPPQSPPTSP